MTLNRVIMTANILLLAVAATMLLRPLPSGRPPVAADHAPGGPRVPAASAPEQAVLAPPQTEDYRRLVDGDLFGVIAAARVQRRDEPADTAPVPPAPAQPLALTLLGTVAGGSDLARAIIQPQGQKAQGVYRTGERVMGAEIVGIERKRVLLSRDGRTYELTMDMTQAIEIEGEEVVLSMDAFRDVVEVDADGVINVDRAEALERGGGMFALMRQVQDNLQVEPYVEDGQTLGLRLRGVDNIGVAQLAGIREGDVVRSVNGQVISSVSKALQVFRKARHLEDVNVQLLRDGQAIEKSYKLR